MTFIDSVLSHMSSITTWKRVRNSRTHPKVPITIMIIIIIIIVLPIHYSFSFYSILVYNNQEKFSSLLSLKVPHSHLTVLLTFSKTPLCQGFLIHSVSSSPISLSIILYTCRHMKQRFHLYVCYDTCTYASTRFIHYVIATHTPCIYASRPPSVLFDEGHSRYNQYNLLLYYTY